MYYKCVKFHKNPISGLGGVALTRYMDHGHGTDGQGDSYVPPKLCLRGGGGGIDIETLTIPIPRGPVSYESLLLQTHETLEMCSLSNISRLFTLKVRNNVGKGNEIFP